MISGPVGAQLFGVSTSALVALALLVTAAPAGATGSSSGSGPGLPAGALAQVEEEPPEDDDVVYDVAEDEAPPAADPGQAAPSKNAPASPPANPPVGDPSQAPPDAPPAPEPAPAPGATPTPSFDAFKGDLIHIGTRELMSRNDHLGVRLGPHIIGRDFYLGVTPTAAWYDDPWAIALHVPLNLLMFQGGSNEFGGAKLRRRDWDELSDFARVIRFITYGRKEAPVYFTVSNLRPVSLGHGQLVHNYQANIDVDRSMTGVVFEAHNKWVGFQTQLNDITFRNAVVGGLFFVRPLAFVDDGILSSLSFGVEYAADFRAPRCVRVSDADRRCVPGSGNFAGVDPLTGESRDDTFVRTDPDLGRPVVEETLVQAVGASVEMRVMKRESADLKLYGTFHQFIDAGSGVAGGGLLRFHSPGPMVHAVRVRVEGRSFSARFLPAYFDTLYEITKYQSIQSSPSHQVAPTRYQRVFGDPESGFPILDEDQRYGFNVEASWALFDKDRSNKKVSFGLGLTDSTGPDDTNFYAHVELPAFKFLNLFASFLRVNAADLGGLFEPSVDNVVILSGLRAKLLPFMFVNLHYSRAFQIIRGHGREFHLGNERVVDEAGQVSPLFTHDRIYENVQTLFVELELGLERDDR